MSCRAAWMPDIGDDSSNRFFSFLFNLTWKFSWLRVKLDCYVNLTFSLKLKSDVSLCSRQVCSHHVTSWRPFTNFIDMQYLYCIVSAVWLACLEWLLNWIKFSINVNREVKSDTHLQAEGLKFNSAIAGLALKSSPTSICRLRLKLSLTCNYRL
jgi:hypothetical protein